MSSGSGDGHPRWRRRRPDPEIGPPGLSGGHSEAARVAGMVTRGREEDPVEASGREDFEALARGPGDAGREGEQLEAGVGE